MPNYTIENGKFKHSHLNDTQMYIVEAFLRIALDDLADSVIPAMAIRAIQFIQSGEITTIEKREFERAEVWETILKIRLGLLLHPCPQNRHVGDPNAALVVLMSGTNNPIALGVAMLMHPSVRDGIFNGEAFYFDDGGDIAHEAQGVMGLTARNNPTARPVTKQAVVDYVNYLLNQEIVTLSKAITQDSRLSKILSGSMLTKSNWIVGMTTAPRGSNYHIYIEGITKSGVYFLNRYALENTNRKLHVKFSRLDTDASLDLGIEAFNIAHLEGIRLRELILSEHLNSLTRLQNSTLSSSNTFFRNDIIGKAWVAAQIKKINLVPGDGNKTQHDEHRFSCNIM